MSKYIYVVLLFIICVLDKKMFWCDAYTDKIYEYDLMSRERIILVNKTGATFYSMTMQDDRYLYVSDLSIR